MSRRWPAWQFAYSVEPSLPALAWLARIDGTTVNVLCGHAVRGEPQGFFEGSWSGPPELAAVPEATTVFGSGIVAEGDDIVLITPAHTLEPIFTTRAAGGSLLASNTLNGVLEATGRELDPQAIYPPLFSHINRGLRNAATDLPTSGAPITVHYYENLAIGSGGAATVRPKQREEPFATFAEYRDRLTGHVTSVLANAPAYLPKVSVSSGYDSAAAAVIGARAGCRHAVTFRSGWAWRGYTGTDDSGEPTAAALGMTTEAFDRLAYLGLDDAPEAEFLATGMSGEDVVYRSMEAALGGTQLLTGFWGGAAWRGHGRAGLARLDLSGASLGEFRLRTNFIHLPVPYIGAIRQPELVRLRSSAEMRPFSVGGRYDEPVARRLAEEAGIERGRFARQKLAASQRLHQFGVSGLSRSARASLEDFAGAEALTNLPTRRPIGRRHRLALRVAQAVGRPQMVEHISRRRSEGVHFEPVLGSLLLRWAVAELRPRYAAARGFGTDE